MGVPFADHVALLNALVEQHQPVIERIESRLLNVRGKGLPRDRNGAALPHAFSVCVYDSPGVPRDLARLKGQLEAAHRADGFEPVVLEHTSPTVEPVELIVRAYDEWDRHRWPGRNGRLSFARSLFGVLILRQLEALSLRIWDDGVEGAGDRLGEVQRVLDRVNDAMRPVIFVRDARWLIQTAQGPLTRQLSPYFRIAERISQSFTDDSRVEVHTAGAKLAGGHLRSQLRYRTAEMGRPVDDPAVLALTRNSNSMDGALLVRDLVPLLGAYAAALHAHEDAMRLNLADAILQGLSADPELFLERLDLLGPCTAIEDVFVERGEDGCVRFTAAGTHQHDVLERYTTLVGKYAGALHDDAAGIDPATRTYSPLGIAYGFCADILSSMAMDSLWGQPGFDLGLEDIFESRGRDEQKRSRVRAWEQRPAHQGQHQPFEHSGEWATQIFRRTVAALERRAGQGTALNASGVASARVFVATRTEAEPGPPPVVPDRTAPAQEHCLTSDVNRALSTGATAFPKSQILKDRNEGRFLASAESGGKWFAVSKTLLTEFTSRGQDAVIADVPAPVVDVLRLTGRDLVVVV